MAMKAASVVEAIGPLAVLLGLGRAAYQGAASVIASAPNSDMTTGVGPI
jgi:hypothetical protein